MSTSISIASPQISYRARQLVALTLTFYQTMRTEARSNKRTEDWVPTETTNGSNIKLGLKQKKHISAEETNFGRRNRTITFFFRRTQNLKIWSWGRTFSSPCLSKYNFVLFPFQVLTDSSLDVPSLKDNTSSILSVRIQLSRVICTGYDKMSSWVISFRVLVGPDSPEWRRQERFLWYQCSVLAFVLEKHRKRANISELVRVTWWFSLALSALPLTYPPKSLSVFVSWRFLDYSGEEAWS